MKTLALVGVALVLAGSAAAKSPPGVVHVAFNATLNQKILVDGKGLTLYMYDGDYKTVSGCNDVQCLGAWPPLLAAKGKAIGGAGVNKKLLKTAKQHDGRVQVMYAGHLLYTWAGFQGQLPADTPGDVNGMAVIGAWWPLTPAGKAIKTKP